MSSVKRVYFEREKRYQGWHAGKQTNFTLDTYRHGDIDRVQWVFDLAKNQFQAIGTSIRANMHLGIVSSKEGPATKVHDKREK